MTATSNVVGRKELRKCQSWTLRMMADIVMSTYGPKASNTMLISDNSYTEYSKDGHTVGGDVKFTARLEEAIRQEVSQLTLEIANTVGDGTTSAVILASLILDAFAAIEDENTIKPYDLIKRFKDCVEKLKAEILSRTQEFTPDMAYKIAYIATNGNDWVAEQLKGLYDKYGKELEIQVMASPNQDTYLREYDGLTLTSGYADTCYQNIEGKALSEIKDAEIYAFADPIDTPSLGDVFQKIIEENIVTPGMAGKKMTPTVILSPKIGYDYDFVMSKLAKMLLAYPDVTVKPPILVVTNIPGNSLYDTIVNLAGAKWIKKFIDPKVKEQEAKNGNVATITNFKTFAGKAELVKADAVKTVFVNPKDMYEIIDGEAVPSKAYTTFLTNIKNELAEAERSTKDLNVIGNLRRRLHCLQSNMVDFCVGGLTVGDRDSLMHLVEDAVKSCKSAATYGVGYAANCEGLLATRKFINDDTVISPILAKAYEDLVSILYTSCLSEEDAKNALAETFQRGEPIDLRAEEFNGTVLGSIMADVVVLETISKILSLMITCNQAIMPPQYMVNYEPKDVD